MRLVSYPGGFGRVDGEAVVPMGPDLVEYLATGRVEDGEPVALSDVVLLAPVPRPGKVVAIGLNYRDHAAESEQPIPEEPILFAKFANSVIGPGEAIRIPPATQSPDYEAELGVVIGRTAREVDRTDALTYVAGYTCANDVSARDLQLRVSQWTRGKAVDTFLPLGPWLVTADEIPDPDRLAIRCLLNGEVMQDSNTDQMIFGVAELVSFISQTMTLEPGDVISTGTPPGVGFLRDPPRLLREGDEVTVELERIGTLTNPVRARR
jgi:2-keto-4-pentenoate hydratase/2-oxohepta-3-ene-1,7-dioic acid hydratase in catechol pathway